MKFSVNWLREFVELPAGVDELAELLTMGGVEIEGIEKRGANFDKVVVAQIKASEQHPNADRLSVCQVDDGSGQPRQIVLAIIVELMDNTVNLPEDVELTSGMSVIGLVPATRQIVDGRSKSGTGL